MSKKYLSEEDIKLRYITPAIKNSGWEDNRLGWSINLLLDV